MLDLAMLRAILDGGVVPADPWPTSAREAIAGLVDEVERLRAEAKHQRERADTMGSTLVEMASERDSLWAYLEDARRRASSSVEEARDDHAHAANVLEEREAAFALAKARGDALLRAKAAGRGDPDGVRVGKRCPRR